MNSMFMSRVFIVNCLSRCNWDFNSDLGFSLSLSLTLIHSFTFPLIITQNALEIHPLPNIGTLVLITLG